MTKKLLATTALTAALLMGSATTASAYTTSPKATCLLAKGKMGARSCGFRIGTSPRPTEDIILDANGNRIR